MISLLAKNQATHDKLVAEAQAVGLELIGKGKDKRYRLYRFPDCRHEQELYTTNVRVNIFRCSVCLDLKLEQEAQALGLELIGSGKEHHYRLYRFTSCGHEQELFTKNVRENKFHCKRCLNEKLEQEAKSVGLELITKGKNSQYRLYRFIDCGHDQEIHTGSVRTNQFRCQTCGDHSWTKPSYLYKILITCGSFSWLKIGYSKNLEKRIKEYGLPSHATVKVLSTTLYETGEEAKVAEQLLLKELKAHQLDPEFMKQYHTKQGATECFQISY